MQGMQVLHLSLGQMPEIHVQILYAVRHWTACTHAASHIQCKHLLQCPRPSAVQIRTGDPEGDYRLGEMLTEFPIAGYHYFCETVDLTRPFPSDAPATEPCWEFVWNSYLTQPFRRIGLPNVAPYLLQGLAERRTLPDLHGKLFDLVLFARRSRLHAGTRCARAPPTLSAVSRHVPSRTGAAASTRPQVGLGLELPDRVSGMSDRREHMHGCGACAGTRRAG